MMKYNMQWYFFSLLDFQLDFYVFRLEKFNSFVSFTQQITNTGDSLAKLNNNFLTNSLFDFNYSILIICLLVIAILLIKILASKPFNEGIKTVINIGTAMVLGATLAGAGNSRDRDEEERRKQKEEEERKQKEEEERKQKEEDERKQKEEDERKQKEEDEKNAKKSWW